MKSWISQLKTRRWRVIMEGEGKDHTLIWPESEDEIVPVGTWNV